MHIDVTIIYYMAKSTKSTVVTRRGERVLRAGFGDK